MIEHEHALDMWSWRYSRSGVVCVCVCDLTGHWLVTCACKVHPVSGPANACICVCVFMCVSVCVCINSVALIGFLDFPSLLLICTNPLGHYRGLAQPRPGGTHARTHTHGDTQSTANRKTAEFNSNNKPNELCAFENESSSIIID